MTSFIEDLSEASLAHYELQAWQDEMENHPDGTTLDALTFDERSSMTMEYLKRIGFKHAPEEV